jgi:hypothetical protein
MFIPSRNARIAGRNFIAAAGATQTTGNMKAIFIKLIKFPVTLRKSA